MSSGAVAPCEVTGGKGIYTPLTANLFIPYMLEVAMCLR